MGKKQRMSVAQLWSRNNPDCCITFSLALIVLPRGPLLSLQKVETAQSLPILRISPYRSILYFNSDQEAPPHLKGRAIGREQVLSKSILWGWMMNADIQQKGAAGGSLVPMTRVHFTTCTHSSSSMQPSKAGSGAVWWAEQPISMAANSTFQHCCRYNGLSGFPKHILKTSQFCPWPGLYQDVAHSTFV